MHMSGGDASVFVGQFALPHNLRTFFGRARVVFGYLLEAGLSMHDFEHVLPFALRTEFDRLCQADCEAECVLILLQAWHRLQKQRLVPERGSWPMCFGWSLFVAQSYVIDTVRSVGLAAGRLVAEAVALLDPDQPAISAATDDVLCFARVTRLEFAA